MRPCERQGSLERQKQSDGWPIIPAGELGKYNISFEEENGAAVLRYVDCGKAFGNLPFNRAGREGLI